MVRPERVAVTPPSTWKTPLVPPPLIVTPRRGPVIVSGRWCRLSSSGPAVNSDRLGVAKTVGSKVIVWAPVRTLARLTAPQVQLAAADRRCRRPSS